jgi:serine O-acetyltransferase
MAEHRLNELIAADLYRYRGRVSNFPLLHALFNATPGFKYTYVLRHAANTPSRSLTGMFWRLLLRHYSYRYGFQIEVETKIGKGLYVGHFGTIVVNGKVEIGENCNLNHSITIGQANRGKKKGAPILGNRVWIGTGPVIVGKITIGDDVLIAPNSYVNADVPSHSIVIGNPAKIISRENATQDYVAYTAA